MACTRSYRNDGDTQPRHLARSSHQHFPSVLPPLCTPVMFYRTEFLDLALIENWQDLFFAEKQGNQDRKCLGVPITKKQKTKKKHISYSAQFISNVPLSGCFCGFSSLYKTFFRILQGPQHLTSNFIPLYPTVIDCRKSKKNM